MYVFIVPSVLMPVESADKECLPEAYGTYEDRNMAIGAAIDLIRCRNHKEPSFTFQSFGEDMENLKMLVTIGEECYLGATINKLY